MIARIAVFIILAIVISDLYIERHFLRRRTRNVWWKRLLWWLPGLILIGYTIVLSLEKNFTPDNVSVVNLFLLLCGLIVVPKLIFTICSAIGLLFRKIRGSRYNWGNLIAFFLSIFWIYILLYGSTVGFRKLRVNRVDLYSEDLPSSFEGYRMTVFSDAHLGSYIGNKRKIFDRAIDSINAQHADMICFLGDIQNIQPQDFYPFVDQLRSLKAKDGVFSVLGNHDYSLYIDADPAVKAANDREVISRETQFGWTLLLNDHRAIHRGSDSIVIAGVRNDSKPPYEHEADLPKALEGVAEKAFVVLLMHDPSPWHDYVFPTTKTQLTLSGHTHGGQVSILGLRPTMFTAKHDRGLYTKDNRMLFVTSGLGGVVPFRFGVPGEITVITLHKGKEQAK